jgi:hypothetical protein
MAKIMKAIGPNIQQIEKHGTWLIASAHELADIAALYNPDDGGAVLAKAKEIKKMLSFAKTYGMGSMKFKESIAQSSLGTPEVFSLSEIFDAAEKRYADPIAGPLFQATDPVLTFQTFEYVAKAIAKAFDWFAVHVEVDYYKQRFRAALEGPKEHQFMTLEFVYDVPIKDVAKALLHAMQEAKANEGAEMALQLKSFNGFSTISKLGVSQELFDWFKANGNASWDGNGIKLTVGAHSGVVAITLAHVQSLNLGTLTAHIKADYRIKFTALLHNLLGKYGSEPAPFVNPAKFPSTDELQKSYGLPPVSTPVKKVTAPFNIEAVKAVKPDFFKKLGEAVQDDYGSATGSFHKQQVQPVKSFVVVAGNEWPLFDLATLPTAPLVALETASRMYQPVKGTSEGKRYYVVACNKDLRIAAAFKQSELSVRIEGPAYDAKVDQLKTVFPNATQGKGYASLHLEVGNDLIASKAMGALLMALGVAWETPMPSLAVIKGK